MRAGGTKAVNQANDRAGFGDVFRVPAFRVLYGAELQSIVGDELSRVALSVLVFTRTGSASLTALVFALTFLPSIVGGVVLAPLGDRLPRPVVMIGCDLLRGVAFSAMAVRGVPLGVLGALLAVAVFVGPAFNASAGSLLASLLRPEQFRTASGIRMTTNQLAQVFGFAVAGVLVAAVGTRPALLVNAVTYLVSALIIAGWLRRSRPAGRVEPAEPGGARTSPERGVSTWQVMCDVLAQKRLRMMLGLSVLAGLFIVPESLAVPYAAQIGASTTETGLLLATIPLGSAVGITLIVRVVSPQHRPAASLAMAVATGIPLVVSGLVQSLGVAAACWFVSGLAGAYQVEVFVTLVAAVPDERRARVISVVSSLLLGAQGLGPIVFGALASAASAGLAVAAAGGLGATLALVLVATRSMSVPGRLGGRAGAHRRAE